MKDVHTLNWENRTLYKEFLLKYDKEFTYHHSIRVANEARKIATMFHENEEKAEIAGYLHDISAIFPNEERIKVAEAVGIEKYYKKNGNFNDYSSKTIESNRKRDI